MITSVSWFKVVSVFFSRLRQLLPDELMLRFLFEVIM